MFYTDFAVYANSLNPVLVAASGEIYARDYASLEPSNSITILRPDMFATSVDEEVTTILQNADGYAARVQAAWDIAGIIYAASLTSVSATTYTIIERFLSSPASKGGAYAAALYACFSLSMYGVEDYHKHKSMLAVTPSNTAEFINRLIEEPSPDDSFEAVPIRDAIAIIAISMSVASVAVRNLSLAEASTRARLEDYNNNNSSPKANRAPTRQPQDPQLLIAAPDSSRDENAQLIEANLEKLQSKLRSANHRYSVLEKQLKTLMLVLTCVDSRPDDLVINRPSADITRDLRDLTVLLPSLPCWWTYRNKVSVSVSEIANAIIAAMVVPFSHGKPVRYAARMIAGIIIKSVNVVQLLDNIRENPIDGAVIYVAALISIIASIFETFGLQSPFVRKVSSGDAQLLDDQQISYVVWWAGMRHLVEYVPTTVLKDSYGDRDLFLDQYYSQFNQQEA